MWKTQIAELKRRCLDIFACAHCRETKSVEVTIPAALSCTGETRRAQKPVDACIADIVRALNAADGPVTIGSCCGHGRCDGEIRLLDGRIIKVIYQPGEN